ncbi:DUF1493 family protein [Qipengyuania sp. ASV99]|uniref:DUF1493 family protein n=1 Tax=Qipengyuania sp. ASV99 TaxID=3399681 RepID=UPI003A4C70CA
MDTDADAEELVVSVIARRSGRKFCEISRGLRLVQDLKLDGDDAIDALLEISKVTGLSLDGFQADMYFHSEPSLLSLFKAKEGPKAELTVGQIVSAATSGGTI